MSSSMPGPVEGPCEAWISGAEVAACCGAANSDEVASFDVFATEASMLLFEMSGRKYTGGCRQTVRPCASNCNWWIAAGGPSIAGTAAWYWGPWQGVWGWTDANQGLSGLCGCGWLSRVLLSGYPVTNIVEVKIGGDTIDPAEYRLDDWRYLSRLGFIDDQNTFQPRWWPACQNLALDDDQPGTWSVEYDYGVMPPLAGIEAAKQARLRTREGVRRRRVRAPAGRRPDAAAGRHDRTRSTPDVGERRHVARDPDGFVDDGSRTRRRVPVGI